MPAPIETPCGWAWRRDGDRVVLRDPDGLLRADVRLDGGPGGHRWRAVLAGGTLHISEAPTVAGARTAALEAVLGRPNDVR